MNYQRLYEYRFRGIDQEARGRVWTEIARHVHRELGSPERVLDPAAGRCEFINAIPARERWVVDEVDYAERSAAPGVNVIISDIFDADLPESYFDAVFVSNFLEHLPTQEHVARFLSRMWSCLKPGGRIAIMGPNYKYCSRDYWDCADHTLALTHVAVGEHLYTAGFEVRQVVPRFLPYSFRGRFPASSALTGLYLRMRLAWPMFGKQFFLVGQRPAGVPALTAALPVG